MRSFLLWFAFLASVLAADPNNYFLTPAEGSNITLTAGTSVQIQWITNLTTGYNIRLWQQWPQGGGANALQTVYITPTSTPGTDQFTWTVSYFSANLTFSNRFFLWANYDGSTPVPFSSAYFQINAASVITGTTPAPTATPSSTTFSSSPVPSTASTGSASSSTGSPTSSPSTTNTAAASMGSSNVAVGVGVGVGVGAGILAVAGIVAWVLLRRRKRVKAAAATSDPHFPPSPPYEEVQSSQPAMVYESGGVPIGSNKSPAYKQPVFHEADGQRPAAELA